MSKLILVLSLNDYRSNWQNYTIIVDNNKYINSKPKLFLLHREVSPLMPIAKDSYLKTLPIQPPQLSTI